MRKEKLEELFDKLKKTLKSFGYINTIKIIDKEKVSYTLSKTKDGVLIYVSNSHNSYIEYPDLYLYRQVCLNLVRVGYEISMNYPCGITVTDHVQQS